MRILEALAASPILGLVIAGGLYYALRVIVRRGPLLEPPHGDQPSPWWLRGLLILTCTSVSYSHGSNDGQKSIGLIMLTIIGLLPATYALNPQAGAQLAHLSENATAAAPLIGQYGDDRKAQGVEAATALQSFKPETATPTADESKDQIRLRTERRGQIYTVLAELKHVAGNHAAPADARANAAKIRKAMGGPVHYAPIWVKILSAVCYKRIVKTLGERLGKSHMTPGQGGSAEIVGSVLIGTAGITGLPVSTTHIITSGIAGTMIAGGQGVQRNMLIRIGLAWLFTLPATILISGGLFYILDSPSL